MRLSIIIGILSLALTAGSYVKLSEVKTALDSAAPAADEMLYLPNGEALHFLSFGYKNLLSDVLWFTTINYFGKHFRSDRSYQWLNHMCNLVVDLNPRATHAFEFCSLMLAWEANAPKESVAILTKAIEHHPDNWRFPYLRGMNQMLFFEDEKRAKEDFVQASKVPNAPSFVARIAAKRMAALDSPQTAMEFLMQMIRNSHDEAERAALSERLKEVQYEAEIQQLQKLVQIYRDRQGSAPKSLDDLLHARLIKEVPHDPFGGIYTYNPAEGTILSSTGHKRMNALSRGSSFVPKPAPGNSVSGQPAEPQADQPQAKQVESNQPAK